MLSPRPIGMENLYCGMPSRKNASPMAPITGGTCPTEGPIRRNGMLQDCRHRSSCLHPKTELSPSAHDGKASSRTDEFLGVQNSMASLICILMLDSRSIRNVP